MLLAAERETQSRWPACPPPSAAAVHPRCRGSAHGPGGAAFPGSRRGPARAACRRAGGEAGSEPGLSARRRPGAQRPCGGLGSPPAPRPHLRVQPRLGQRGWRRSADSVAAASPRAQKGRLAFSSPTGALNSRNPAREGRRRQNSRSSPAHGTGAASRRSASPGGVVPTPAPARLAGVDARLGLLTVSRLLYHFSLALLRGGCLLPVDKKGRSCTQR